MPDEKQVSALEVVKGVSLGFLLNGLAILVLFGTIRIGVIAPGIGIWAILFFGVTQLLALAPAIAVGRAKGRRHLVAGLIIAASITFLLNAACWSSNSAKDYVYNTIISE